MKISPSVSDEGALDPYHTRADQGISALETIVLSLVSYKREVQQHFLNSILCSASE